MIHLQDKKEHISYYVNSNSTMTYIYDSKKNSFQRFLLDEFAATNLDIIEEKRGSSTKRSMNFKEILSKENSIFTTVTPIASTVKPIAYFKDKDDNTGVSQNFLNEFVGSEKFTDARSNNKYTHHQDNNLMPLLKNEAPTFFHLISNLLHNENDDVKNNFLRYLHQSCFKDYHQDTFWLFMGTSEQNQGQGAGKGVFVEFLKEIMSGLVTYISNTTYDSNFNSNLLNKKIVVFDELSFKKLNYEKIKYLTGSSTIRIEYKGKDAIEAKNVMSLLAFTNEHDMHEKISLSDRRAHIITPNPINGSLQREIIKKRYGSFEAFSKCLSDESTNIIHIIAKADQPHKKPLELPTSAKVSYFKEKGKISSIDIQDTKRIFSDPKLLKKVCDILIKNGLLEDSKKLKQLKSRAINRKLFDEILSILQSNGFAPKNLKSTFAWEQTKEYSLNHGFTAINLDMPKTKLFKRYREKTVLIPSSYGTAKKRSIKQLIRESYGSRIKENTPIEIEVPPHTYSENTPSYPLEYTQM